VIVKSGGAICFTGPMNFTPAHDQCDMTSAGVGGKTALMEHRIALPFSETTQKDQRVRFCSAGWSANAQRARWLAPIL
jgi:hypothetical protein